MKKPVQVDGLKERIKWLEENSDVFLKKPLLKARFNTLREIVYSMFFRYSRKQNLYNKAVSETLELVNNKANGYCSALSQRYESQLEYQGIVISALREKINLLTIGKSANMTPENVYFSQFGEDRWIVKNLKLPKKGVFVDVGAADGVELSNSYYFEKLGWSGVCIEPDPRNYSLAKKFRENVLKCAVSKKEGKVKFGMSHMYPTWSGLAISGQDIDYITVESHTLENILAKEKITHIDLLSIDTEGTELDVWESFDYKKYSPEIVIVEFDTQGKINESLLKYFKKLPYKLVHTTDANYIFQLKKSGI